MIEKFKNIISNKSFIILLIITIIRLLMSINLPAYYIKNLVIDDYLMIEQANSILSGEYLGNYNNTTLIKGFIHPFFIAFCTKFNLSYQLVLTVCYILSCIYITTSLNKLVKNKKWLIFLYIILLFNPITYSMDLFQRVYRNSLPLFQTLIFIGTIIRLISTENLKRSIFYYFVLGLITSMMLLTREDSIWAIIPIIMLIIYQLFNNKKRILLPLITISIIGLNLNIVSEINKRYYETYTYNELNKSSFKDAYIKLQEIKDDNKRSRYSIPESTFHKLLDLSEVLDITHDEITILYKQYGDINDEIDNGSIIWAFRALIYNNQQFNNGYEANFYFKQLADEIEKLFEEGKLEREIVIPSVLINSPTSSCIKKLPGDFIKTLKYISSYNDIRTASKKSIIKLKTVGWDDKHNLYYLFSNDHHNTDKLVKENIDYFDAINTFYKYFTTIFSIITPFIFLKNLKKIKEKKQYIITIILMSLLILTMGVSYSNTTGYFAIRYFYLGPSYLLQSLFIILTLETVNYQKIKNKYFNNLFNHVKKLKNKILFSK